MIYNELIAQSGLSKDQADMYSTLLEGGYMTARKLSVKTGLKRGLAYKVLDQLVDMGLVEKNEKVAKVALFFPAHPSKIKEVLKRRQDEIASAESALSGVMGQMVSTYNLVSGKPNVQFFEGIEGVKKVAFDAIETATVEILEYLDDEAVLKGVPELNVSHVEARKKAGIKKRMIAVDSKTIRERVKGFDPLFTEVRVVKTPTFATVMQIYNNKVSYITLNPERIIGVIIEGKEIYEMHKALFEEAWTKAEKIV